MNIHTALAEALAAQRYKGLAPTMAGIIRTALEKNDIESLVEWLPKAVATALESEAQARKAAEEADEMFEVKARHLANRHTLEELERRLAEHTRKSRELGAVATRATERMARSGHRSTSGAVAGEAHAGSFADRRLLERAIELAE